MTSPCFISTIEKVTFYRGSALILSQLSFSLMRGHTYILIGANGAGKSTLLRILARLLLPNYGTINHFSPIGYLGHLPGLYSALSVQENLKLFQTAKATEQSMMAEVNNWNLSSLLSKRLSSLSKGQVQRVALCRLWLQEAHLFLLDEPSASLDDSAVQQLIKRCQQATKQSKTSIISTHDIARMRDLATGCLYLESGAITISHNQQEIDEIVNEYQKTNR